MRGIEGLRAAGRRRRRGSARGAAGRRRFGRRPCSKSSPDRARRRSRATRGPSRRSEPACRSISPPRRRMHGSCSPPPLSAANDHSGSADAAMMRTFTPSHFGAFHGSLVSTGPSTAPRLVDGRRLERAGDVIERVAIEDRLGVRVARRRVARRRRDLRAPAGGGASAFSSGARPMPTSCVTACALSSAAIAISGRITSQKFFLRS